MAPKVLLADIETAPMLGYIWGLFDQNIGLNQIKSDWCIIAWAAKWLGEPPGKVMYQDSRGNKNLEDDKQLVKGLWGLLDEADIVVWQNGRNFDHKKLNARFVLNGMQPPKAYKQIDTLQLAKKHFAFSSNKLEYMSDKLNTKYKKLKHEKYPGFDMWRECLAGNQDAWREMERYNKHDVLALEELYTKLIPWDTAVNFNLWSDSEEHTCSCGGTDWMKRGFYMTATGRFQCFRCKKCGAQTRSRINELSKERMKALKVGIQR